MDVTSSELTRYSLRPGDVLFTEGGDADKLGRGCVWHGQVEPCIHQNHVFAVRPNRDIVRPAFLSAAARSSAGRAYFELSAKQTTNLASINSSQLKAMPLLLPPIDEQDRITAVLGAVDDAIDKAEAVIAATDRLRQALLLDLLTRGLPGRHSEWKRVLSIGMMPACWAAVPLGKILVAIGAGVSPICLPRPALPGEWEVLKLSSISWGTFRPAENKALPPDAVPDPGAQVRAGDVLISRANAEPVNRFETPGAGNY